MKQQQQKVNLCPQLSGKVQRVGASHTSYCDNSENFLHVASLPPGHSLSQLELLSPLGRNFLLKL